jgi:hypothetical protein
MEQDIVTALKWLDSDEKLIATSTSELSTDLRTTTGYYESKLTEKRKAIEEKYRKLEKERVD